MEYLLITGTASKCADTSKLNTQVNQKLKEGYKLHGSPGLTFDTTHTTPLYL